MNLAIIHNELDRLFDVFNTKYFENFLEKPMIIIQSTGKKPINGYCMMDKTWKKIDDNKELYEIGISAEHLARDKYGICSTLLHEMTHLFNLMTGVKDVASNYVYHNKRFKLEAEKHGLIITQAPKIGWSRTELNDECKEFVETLNINPEVLLYARMIPYKEKKENKYKKYKFVCHNCGEIIYSQNKKLELGCDNCSMYSRDEVVFFQLEEK